MKLTKGMLKKIIKEELGNLGEDSGEEEKEHYEFDDWSDKDHIDSIRKHLDALEKDKDYDEEHEDL
jgi:hypothetical protein